MAEIEGDYWRDGAVCVRQAFDAQAIELAREAIDANLADLSPHAKRASAEDDGAFVEDFCSWQRIAPMERFIRESPAAKLAAELTGSKQIRLYHDHVLVKEPGTRQRTPWHQDLPYYNIDGRLNISMWFPVDPVNRESTLEFVAGSHLGPWYMPRTFLDGQAKWFPDGTLQELPDIDPDSDRILGWEARARRRRLLPHAHAPRCRRRQGREPPARAVGPISRRRHGPRAAALDDVAAVSRAGSRAPPPALRSTTRCSPCSGARDSLSRWPRPAAARSHR